MTDITDRPRPEAELSPVQSGDENDIVDRLRESARLWAIEIRTRLEAADEIELLRARLTEADRLLWMAVTMAHMPQACEAQIEALLAGRKGDGSDEQHKSPCANGNIIDGHACYCHAQTDDAPRKCPVWRHFGEGDLSKWHSNGDFDADEWDGGCKWFMPANA